MLEAIRQRLRATPFQAFVVLCSSGSSFRVEHPENAAVVGHSVTIAMPDPDQVVTLSGLHIVGVVGADTVSV